MLDWADRRGAELAMLESKGILPADIALSPGTLPREARARGDKKGTRSPRLLVRLAGHGSSAAGA